MSPGVSRRRDPPPGINSPLTPPRRDELPQALPRDSTYAVRPPGGDERSKRYGAAARTRGVAAGRSAQRACERSSDWRRGAAGSPDPEHLLGSPDPEHLLGSPDPEHLLGSPDPEHLLGSTDPEILPARPGLIIYPIAYCLLVGTGCAPLLSVGRGVLSLLLLLAMVGPAARTVAAPDRRTDDLATMINRTRVERGLPPLQRVTELDSAAETHSQDMVVHDYLDHTGADGSSPQERAEQAGYQVPQQSAWIVVEVISAISGEPAGPLDWWLNQSPEVHGKVLLDPRWREMGVGYAAGGEYGNYWTVLVGCRPGVLPKVVLDGKTYDTTERCGDPASILPSLTVASRSATAGADLEVRWTGIQSASARDWLGLYRESDADGAYRAWTYVSCAWMPLTPRVDGWCWLHLPPDLPGGTYDVRLHADDSNTRLADSASVTVTGR
jgi:hypothetical protein